MAQTFERQRNDGGGVPKNSHFTKFWQPLRKLVRIAAHAWQFSSGERAVPPVAACPVITPNNTPEFTLPSKHPYNRSCRTAKQRQQVGDVTSYDFQRFSAASHDAWMTVGQTDDDDYYTSESVTEGDSHDSDGSHERFYVSWPATRDLEFGRRDQFAEFQSDYANVERRLPCPALELEHLRSKTSYGFETLHTQPRTLRRESLFHDLISRSVPILDRMMRDDDSATDGDSMADHRGRLRRKSLTMNDICTVSASGSLTASQEALFAADTRARGNAASPSLVRKVFGKVHKICLKHRRSPKGGRRSRASDERMTGTIEGTVCYLLPARSITMYDFTSGITGGWRTVGENGQIYLKFSLIGGAGGDDSDDDSSFDAGVSDGLSVAGVDGGKQTADVRRLEFDALLCIRDVDFSQLSDSCLRVQCCVETAAGRPRKVVGVVYMDLKHLPPNTELRVREDIQSVDSIPKQDQLRVMSPRNAVEVGVTLATGLQELVITIYSLSKTRRDKLTKGVYVSLCLVQPARSPQNARTTLQTHNSDQLSAESFTFEVSECLRGMTYICAIITLMNQTSDEVDEVLGRVCLGELAITEQEVEHWSSALSNPGVTYKRWHTFRME